MGDLSIARAQGEAAQGRAQVEGAASTGAGSGGGRLGSATTPENGPTGSEICGHGRRACREKGREEGGGGRKGRPPAKRADADCGGSVPVSRVWFPSFFVFFRGPDPAFFFLRGGPDPAETLEKYPGPKQKKNKHPPT
jgi:hypothetical protein